MKCVYALIAAIALLSSDSPAAAASVASDDQHPHHQQHPYNQQHHQAGAHPKSAAAVPKTLTQSHHAVKKNKSVATKVCSMQRDQRRICSLWATAGKCKTWRVYMSKVCKTSCGICDEVKKPAVAKATKGAHEAKKVAEPPKKGHIAGKAAETTDASHKKRVKKDMKKEGIEKIEASKHKNDLKLEEKAVAHALLAAKSQREYYYALEAMRSIKLREEAEKERHLHDQKAPAKHEHHKNLRASKAPKTQQHKAVELKKIQHKVKVDMPHHHHHHHHHHGKSFMQESSPEEDKTRATTLMTKMDQSVAEADSEKEQAAEATKDVAAFSDEVRSLRKSSMQANQEDDTDRNKREKALEEAKEKNEERLRKPTHMPEADLKTAVQHPWSTSSIVGLVGLGTMSTMSVLGTLSLFGLI